MRILLGLFKLALLLAVVNATARMGIATWKNMELKDSAQQAVLFGRDRPSQELLAGILGKAAALDLPLADEQVNISQDGVKTIIDVAYENRVEVFPNYTYPMQFSFTVEAFKTR